MPMPPGGVKACLGQRVEQPLRFSADLEYLREINNRRDHTARELRRLSSVLRRLLVERDITIVVSALGRFMFTIPDNQPIYDASEGISLHFFSSGGAKIFGEETRLQ